MLKSKKGAFPLSNFLISILLGMLLGFILPSCHKPKSPEFISYDGLKVEKLGFKNSSIKANLHFFNPNNWSLKLEKTDLDIYVNETFLGHSSQQIGLLVPKKGPFTVPLLMEVDMKNLLKNTVSSLLNKRVTIRVKGKITAGKAKISFTFPVDFTTEQELSLF